MDALGNLVDKVAKDFLVASLTNKDNKEMYLKSMPIEDLEKLFPDTEDDTLETVWKAIHEASAIIIMGEIEVEV